MNPRWICRSRRDWRWTLRADLSHSAVGTLTEPDWSRLLNLPGVDVFKAASRRSVIRLPASDDAPAIYCKAFVSAGLADWCRSRLRGSPARWEASRIGLAKARGLPTAELLGYGERRSWTGVLESRLLTRSIDDVAPLSSWCMATELPEVNLSDSPPDRECWLGALADLLAGLHGRGLWHGDLHAGNVLLRREGSSWRCWLIDLAALRGSRQTPLRHVQENLARFWLSIERLSTIDERLNFARRYWQSLSALEGSLARQIGCDADAAPASLLAAAAQVVEPIQRKADKVWLRGNRKVFVADNGRCLASLREPWWREFSEQIDRLWASANDSVVSAEVESRRLLRQTPFGERSFRLTRFPKSASANGLTRAHAAWEVGHALHRRACPVAVPWGYVECADADYLIACEPQGSIPLTEWSQRSQQAVAPRVVIRSIAQRIENHGYSVEETTVDAVRFSADGQWCGWCALEAIHPRR